jgi:hypothetical protein
VVVRKKEFKIAESASVRLVKNTISVILVVYTFIRSSCLVNHIILPSKKNRTYK